jgi:phosphoglycolate phosphatase
MEPKLLIFDFDGTLSDSLAAAVDTLNELAGEFDFRHIRAADVPMLKSMSYPQACNHLGIPAKKVWPIIRRGRTVMQTRLGDVALFEGIPGLLRTLPAAGIRFGIMTTNSRSNVETVLSRSRCESTPAFIHSCDRFFGKAWTLRGLALRNGLRPGNILYVGDEVRDVEAAARSGAAGIAVTWGYHARSLLEDSGARRVVATVDELREAIASSFGIPLAGASPVADILQTEGEQAE